MVIARGMRPTLNVSSTSFWNPSFSSRMATGNKPPYAVRLLPSKSYGVEAPILLGSGITRSAPCGTRLSSLCSLLRLTIWVTPRSRLAKLELRGLSVLQQDFRGPQVVLSFSPSYSTQRPCIGQVSWSMELVEQLDSVIIERLRKQGEFLRRIYRAEFAKDPISRATVSSRSNVIAVQHTVRQIYGEDVVRSYS